ncbi:unnamed protein product [Ranitomeya imitator]|uniref:non-specific serine/threonine protein kinase n=2 Tax=Ranitomeya imitator TaxID=111125 RepID=A0ABN9KN75_9NEOB|nr:unnamed protein product [Ranitomeya imitator]
MLCSFPSTYHLCMVMEYAEGGNCQTLLDTRGPLSVPLARLYFAEAVLAVEYLHSYGVVHRDLKPENLLITSAGHIKVTDFGLSKLGVMIPKNYIYNQSAQEISREFRDHEVYGSPHYIAPEVILKKGYGRPVDWWAMGIILHQFLLGSVPFDGKTLTEIEENIVGGHLCWDREPVPRFDARCLITGLLRKNPERRLGTAGTFEIKGNPFLIGLCFKNLLSQKPKYVPQVASNVDTSFSINEDNESSNYQNFTSSSEWLSILCTTATRRMNNEDPKSPEEFTQASCTNILEMQKESFPASIRDDDITSLPCSPPLSENEAHEEIEQQNSDNEEMGEKREEIPAPEERKSSIYVNEEQQSSDNEEMGETRREIPVHEDIKSSIPLSTTQQNPENEEKKEKRRRSRLRRFLSSCRRRLSRAARAFTCCCSCPSTI